MTSMVVQKMESNSAWISLSVVGPSHRTWFKAKPAVKLRGALTWKALLLWARDDADKAVALRQGGPELLLKRIQYGAILKEHALTTGFGPSSTFCKPYGVGPFRGVAEELLTSD